MTGRVAVIGAGPAGMHAALSAADAGVDAVLVDSAPAVGGQYHRQLPGAFHAERPDRIHRGWSAFAAVRDRITANPRITLLTDTAVWAVEPIAVGHRLWLQTGLVDTTAQRVYPVDAAAAVLATGAYDRVVPFPGWDLPGVYTAGAAQALAKGQRIAVGERVLLGGTGPFLLPVATSLVDVGARVVALLEAARPGVIARGWLTHPGVAVRKLGEACGHSKRLARHRIPVRFRTAVVAAHGDVRVEAATVARLDGDWNPIPGSERVFAVDAVCVGYGFTARVDLASAIGCQIDVGPDGGPVVVVDELRRTSVPGVFAAGEQTGIAGADIAAAEGTLAGRAAADAVGRAADAAGPAKRSVSLGRMRRVADRGAGLAAALGAAYPVRTGWQRWLTDETTICRCEEVSYRQFREAVTRLPGAGTRSIKLVSRAGLGLCQGRICGSTVAELANSLAGDVAASEPVVDPAAWTRRPVAAPVRLGDLAASPHPSAEEP